MKKTTVIADIPRCGLGNKMLVWAKAYIFAREFNLPMYTFGWEQFNIGPWLRGEKSNRYYAGYFKKEGSVWQRLKVKSSYQRVSGHLKMVEPKIKELNKINPAKYRFIVFNEVPNWDDFFGDINQHRKLVRDGLMEMLDPAVKKELDQQAAPGIGLHIRLGDFHKLKEGQDFKDAGATRTPIPYFLDMVKQVRDIAGEELPVTIFTNGKEHELGDLLKLPNISIAPKNSDIVDLLLLSHSQVIVTSAGSTFGYWSGFLSEVPIIMHPDHIWGSIRSDADNEKYFEGALTTPYPKLLIERLVKVQEKIKNQKSLIL
ncbi:MAG: hypothetical protein AAFZ15_01800 [Bacteroidota bacterium]